MTKEQSLLRSLFKPDDRLQRLQNPRQQLIELEMQKRLVMAKDFGRVTLGKTPDFLGNFDHLYPRGTFEMFIESNNNGNISGTIEDCYGTASFTGNLSSTEICFTKHYLPEKSSINASRCDLQYLGQSSDTGYFGIYIYLDKPDFGGRFTISKDISVQS